MRANALLTLLALLALAGCAGFAGEPPGATPATDRSPAEPTTSAATTPYPNASVVFPAGPKAEPTRPDDLTAETAAAFARRYEFRYSYNELWSGPGTEVGMSEHSCSVESTKAAGDGYVVVVKCSAYVNEPAGGGDSTATRHADYPPWSVRYYVDRNSVLREEIDR